MRRHRLFDGRERVLVAVSGGVDSTVLLHLLVRAVRQGALPLELAVAHCHFQLRGAAADGDQAFAEALAREAGLPFYTVRFDTLSHAGAQAVSVEMAARELRYGFFKQCMAQDGWQACALAHHADDQAETLYLNLLRGTGLKGLRGMQPVQGAYIRPLLFARRAEIEAYAAAQGLTYRTDATNADDDYLRNRVRHHLLPLCQQLNPQAVAHAAQTAVSLQRDEAVLSAWYAAAEARLVEKREDVPAEFIAKRKIRRFHGEVGEAACLCFWEWYLKARDFNQEQIEQIIQNYLDGEGGKTFDDRFGRRTLARTPQGWTYTP
ncbi:MAG: tRNA lysidine(34) synthetase TilS [Bacteroidales bacterium]|nr:tRNA lysidine(34) synthetase TilS [Bacteroidales bacterium]